MACAAPWVPFVHRTKPANTIIDFAAPTIIVKVGTPFKTYHVNEQLLCSSSDYFKTALQQQWREGRDRVIELPLHSGELFNAYVNWLHSRNVTLGMNQGQSVNRENNIENLVEAYALGDKLMDSDFKDAVTDAMIVALETWDPERQTYIVPHAGTRTKLYEKTIAGCTARRLLVHRVTPVADISPFVTESDHPGYLLDCTLEAAKKTPETTAYAAARCAFHEHIPGAQHCYRTKYA